MVMDFGFIKEVMIERIHNPCDHGIILWDQDYDVIQHLGISKGIMEDTPKWVKYLLIPTVPTAENLARWWWHEVVDGIANYATAHTMDLWDVHVDELRVWETPNCVAWYRPI